MRMITLNLTIRFDENGSLTAAGEHNNAVVAINMPSAFNNPWCAVIAPKCQGGKSISANCFVNEPDPSVGRQNYQFLRPCDEWCILNGVDVVALEAAAQAVTGLTIANTQRTKARAERRALWQ